MITLVELLKAAQNAHAHTNLHMSAVFSGCMQRQSQHRKISQILQCLLVWNAQSVMRRQLAHLAEVWQELWLFETQILQELEVQDFNHC